jgi:hypothetical protein
MAKWQERAELLFKAEGLNNLKNVVEILERNKWAVLNYHCPKDAEV